MQQHIEMIVKVKQIKETSTKQGKFLYSFGVPITKMVGEEQLTEWVQVAILQDEQRKDLKTAKKVHFIGSLVLKEAYGNYKQGISIFGFYIDPVLSQVYRQRKTRKNIVQDAPQQQKDTVDAPQHHQSEQRGSYKDDFPNLLDSIPF